MDVRRCEAAGAQGRRTCPRGQGPLHPGDEDLPLPRPLDVATRPSTARARRCRRDAQDPRSRSSTCATRLVDGQAADEAELKAIDARGARRSSPTPPNSPAPIPSRDPAELYTDVYTEARPRPDADEVLMPALSPTMEEGNARQVAGQGGRHGQRRRHHRRDRDRQGDHGGRGRRRGQGRRDPGGRGHRGREGQHADRACSKGEGEACAPAGAGGPPNRDQRQGQGRRRPPAIRRTAARSRQAAARRRRRRAVTPAMPIPRSRPAPRWSRPDRARRAARRHGRGDAPRRRRVPDGRGGRRSTRAPTRSARACSRSSATTG